jgi:hypothetical protein
LRTEGWHVNAERIKRLESLTGWAWVIRADSFDVGLAHLKKFVSEHGHARVAAKFVTDDDYLLGGWVGKRRAEFKKGALNSERIKRLEALPCWTWKAR